MGYGTLLVCFTGAECADALLDVALPIAQEHDAHLIGVTVIPPPHMYSALAGQVSATIIEEERTALHEHAEALATDIAARADAAGQAIEWRCIEARAMDTADTFTQAAACADLVIASQADPDDEWNVRSRVPEDLIMDSGRPVILVPFSVKCVPVGRRVLIGWNGRREAIRAVFDALPLLRRADHVEIVTIGTPARVDKDSFTTADDMAATLSRHDIIVQTGFLPEAELSEGEALLAHAKEQDCDLLVIGGYGHSRLRQFVLGGVTRHVLGTMDLPVFMSH